MSVHRIIGQMFIGYTPAIKEQLALSQSVQYLLRHHHYHHEEPKLSVQEICKLVLQNNQTILEDPEKEQEGGEGEQCGRDKRWSSLAQSCDDTYSERVDIEMQERVFAWFGARNIIEGRAESCLKNRLCMRRVQINARKGPFRQQGRDSFAEEKQPFQCIAWQTAFFCMIVVSLWSLQFFGWGYYSICGDCYRQVNTTMLNKYNYHSIFESIMNTGKYPRNQAYIQQSKEEVSPKNKGVKTVDNASHSPSIMSASALSERVHYLEEQLVNLATTLNNDGNQNQQWQEQLTAQNARLLRQVSERDSEIQLLVRKEKQRVEEIRMLKDNLYKQNEQMEILHKQVLELRNQQQNQRGQRTNGPQLEEKVLELNDEVSTLLGKIHQLIEENNQQQSYIEEMDKNIQQYKSAHESLLAELEKANDENSYLKDQIREVEQVSLAQQAEIQNRLLQQLEDTKRALELERNEHKNEQSNVEQYEKRIDTESRTEYEKEVTTLRSEIHTLEEQLQQQKEIEKALRKKYEERMKDTEHESQSLNDQMVRVKHKIRQLQNSCEDHSYALQQLRKDNRHTNSGYGDFENYRNIIVRLEAEKEELSLRVRRNESFKVNESQTQMYSKMFNEAEMKISTLKQQLSEAEEELSRSRRCSRQVTDLAKRWEQDYRKLSEDYQEALKARSKYEQRIRLEQDQLARHKDIYEQVVRKADRFEQMYRQLEVKVRQLQGQRQVGSPRPQSTDSTDLIRLQNSTLRQQISQLNLRIEELLLGTHNPVPSINLDFNERRLQFEVDGYKDRQKDMERLLQQMRNRLTSETANTNEAMEKNRQINEQLLRVNKLLNQKEKQLDELRDRYNNLHYQMTKKDDYATLPKHHPELTKLKMELVGAQRRLMESQMAAKNALQNADYEIQALKMENQHHRKKIQELLQELTSERNTQDYRNLFRSLELSEAKNRELERQLGHYQQKVDHLHQQLRRPSSRERRQSQKKRQQSMRPFLALAQQIPQTQHTIIHEPRRPSISIEPTPAVEPKYDITVNSEAKSTYSSASIYEQLVKDRQELKNARNQFEKRFGDMADYSPIRI